MSLNNLPSSLPLGEPAFCTSTGELFIGQGEGKPLIKVNGKELQNIRKDIETTSEQISEVNQQLDSKSNASHTHDEYVTENELNAKGLATETFVANKIAEASLNGGDVDLSAYATKDYVSGAINEISSLFIKID